MKYFAKNHWLRSSKFTGWVVALAGPPLGGAPAVLVLGSLFHYRAGHVSTAVVTEGSDVTY